MPATNSIPLALSFMEVGCKTNHPYYGSPLLIYINLPPQTILPKTGRSTLRTTREPRTAGITRASPERRGSAQSTAPLQMVAIPTFVDSGDLKNLWFADLLAAKLATETQWVFSRLVPPIGRLSPQITLYWHTKMSVIAAARTLGA